MSIQPTQPSAVKITKTNKDGTHYVECDDAAAIIHPEHPMFDMVTTQVAVIRDVEQSVDRTLTVVADRVENARRAYKAGQAPLLDLHEQAIRDAMEEHSESVEHLKALLLDLTKGAFQ